MTAKLTRISFDGFLWIDLSDPNKKILTEVATELQLPPQTLKDCLKPEHLPKIERFKEVTFIITRMYDTKCTDNSDSVQELTRKMALFWGANFLVTVHRNDYDLITRLQEKINTEQKIDKHALLSELMMGFVQSFDVPIQNALSELEKLELQIFQGTESANLLESGYYLKRRASVFRRILKLTSEVITKFKSGSSDKASDVLQEVQEEIEHSLFYSDELIDNVHNILNLHVSLVSQKTNTASHQTNEVMRVLTIFSVFLLPLNFIAGIYGMNFKIMPELEWKYGYPMALGMMFCVTVVAYYAFKRRGWIR